LSKKVQGIATKEILGAGEARAGLPRWSARVGASSGVLLFDGRQRLLM
jgi:hypothetical protein